MKISNVFKTAKIAVTTRCAKAAFKVKKHSPELLIAGGVVLAVATTVIACKETLKVEAIIDEAKENIDNINSAIENKSRFRDPETGVEGEYTEEIATHDKFIVYVQTGARVIKNYAPAIGLGVLSIAMILCGSNILKKRNVALMAAYSALSESYSTYRKRVADVYGKEADTRILEGITNKVITSESMDEKGNISVVEEEKTLSEGSASPYSVIFDEYSSEWRKSADYNSAFLRCQERAANDKLRFQGHLFLNEVLDMLGIERIPAGQIVGWKYSDNEYVSFGIDKFYPDWDELVGANCNERSYRLEFNIPEGKKGILYDRI